MKIAVDVNGGDRAPGEIIEGALNFAAENPDCGIVMCADRKTADSLPAKFTNPNIDIEIFEHSVGMKDTPAASKKDIPDNTIAGAVRAVKEGRADCAFSCGNSGAVILNSADLLGLKMKNFGPALMSFIPLYGRDPLGVFDVGALGNSNFEADVYFFHLSEAIKIYQNLYSSPEPSVKILNIGNETWKGTREHVKLYKMLEDSGCNFGGNIEGDELLTTEANIIITGGFTGNVTLKLLESFGDICRSFADNQYCQSKNNLLNFYSGDFSYESVGAAILLGVNGRVAIGHGKSTAKAVSSGLKLCLRYSKI
jgi:glycerol-3-phosphate acyltransferase PlsX